MTDISKGAVERLAKTADMFANAMKAFQHHTKKHNEDVRDTLRAQAAHIAAQDAKIAKLVEALREVISALDGEPEYHDQGMGCGLEDRNITDRYQAMEFGWEQAMERVYDEHVNAARDTARQALASTGETDD